MNYKIIFHDGGEVDITNEQKEAIYKLSSKNIKGVDVNGEYIFFSSIARIMKNNDVPAYPALPTINEKLKEFTPERHRRALQNMIKGIKNYIASERNQKTGMAEKLLEKMNNKLAL